MALIANFNLGTVQLDFVNAYLNSDLDEGVYTRYPDGFRRPGKVLKLKKALYGLRRSGYLWQKQLQTRLTELGFARIPEETCVFSDGKIILFFYVDDVVMLARSEDV